MGSPSLNDGQRWLREACPYCHAGSGHRCRTDRHKGKPITQLHTARGWRQRACRKCKAYPGDPCQTPSGRLQAEPHKIRLSPGRGEFTASTVWEELEKWRAATAVVSFTGGGGSIGEIGTIRLEDEQEKEITRWSYAQGQLAEALARPVWARYALFRGHPKIVGSLIWDVTRGEVGVAGIRGRERFAEPLFNRPRQYPPRPLSRDVSRDTSPTVGAPPIVERRCERCDTAIALGARPEARYCSKLCRQAASRARIRTRTGRDGLTAPERCAQCAGPMPEGLRPEALYCSKRCRQAASRARLAIDARAANASTVVTRRVARHVDNV